LIQELVRKLDAPTPGADLAFRLFSEAAAAGLGDLDGPAVVLPMEERAGCRIERVPSRE